MLSPSQTRSYIHLALLFNFLVLAFLFFGSHPTPTDQNLDPRSWQDIEQATTEQASWDIPLGLQQCGFCKGNQTLCDIFGERKLVQAIGYEGTNLRLRRFLAKAAAGNGFTVGVIGGSGHGLGGAKEENSPLNMNRIVFDHLDEMYPAAGGVVMGRGGNGRNGFINGAQGGIGSGYFSMCFGEHIDPEVDLVLLDIAINDELNIPNMANYERLVRGLLDLPNKPAIISMQVFALMFHQIALGGDLHESVSQFYDVPIISLRNLYLHDVLADKGLLRELFVIKSKEKKDDLSDVDTRHISVFGHRRIAELVNAYISWQACEMRVDLGGATETDIDYIDEVYPLPPLPRKYHPDLVVPKLEPSCFSMNAERNKLVPVASEGWNEWNWKAKHYLRATEPGATITFNFTTSLGEVQLHYLRSASFGLGNLLCWVDEDRDKAVKLEGWWNLNINIGKGEVVRNDLESGDHRLHCELLRDTKDPGGGTEFRIISLMSI